MNLPAETTTSRRLKFLTISFELLRDLFSEGKHDCGYSVVADGIPPDAVLVGSRYAWPNCVQFVVYSGLFPEIAEGAEIPSLVPVCSREQAVDHRPPTATSGGG